MGRGRRDGEVVETIEDFAGMKDSRSGLLPDHTVINYNTSSIPLAGTRSLDLHENHIGEHYRQMGPNALLYKSETELCRAGLAGMR
jgi:vacuolar-type H+-ATPase catalytic subunit A/Vma1